MVSQKRRSREKEQRIQSILDAAKKVFSVKGYLKATMEEIAWEAEVTKPTVYLYFKTKDDLFYTLMLPLMEDIHQQLEEVEKRLDSGKIKDGATLIRGLFKSFYHGYKLSPDTFRIIQLFQQQGLGREMDPDVMRALIEKGRMNFDIGRRVLGKGMELGMIKKVNVYEMADAIWGTFVGVTQLEDIKSDEQKNHTLKERTLRLVEQLFAEAITMKPGA
ncbi:MAG TPA: TetR/AcrR family transcriptional regulator [Deltaproteobacteria bacterium]|nr:TetR/AcrR family transcriptional regulator [Deltaproteobacteria bacterium]HPR55157.1 TetR/AcrR family transcriptional regulator [Deltaproteobacteria bacterium]HXK47934.1 TetR/AcrR family transcriptional regulator [Deltaproteobacteria bacterium]